MRMTTPSLPFANRSHFLLRLVFSLALVCELAGAGKAQAQPNEPQKGAQPAAGTPSGSDLKSRYERAVALYNSGQYDKAIDEFQAVYEMRPAPILLFNLAQAHRKAGHREKALDLYERFLRENTAPDPKASKPELEQYNKLKSETDQYIAEIKSSIEADKLAERAAAERAAAEKAAAEKAALEKAAAEKAAADKLAAEMKRKRNPLRPLNITKFALLGAGVALLAAGAALMAVDGRPVCDADMPQMTGQKLCPRELDTKVTGGVLLGGGIAALGASAAVFVLDYKQQRTVSKSSELVALNVSF